MIGERAATKARREECSTISTRTGTDPKGAGNALFQPSNLVMLIMVGSIAPIWFL